MDGKYETMRSLISALENTTQMLHDSIDKQVELDKSRVEAMKFQCVENIKLIKEMWEELKKNN